MIAAAVLAGGKGTRMGGALPKQFLEIGEMPVIIRSIKAFVNSPEVDIVIVSVSAEYKAYTAELIKKHIVTEKEILVIEGGASRGDTLYGVLKFMKARNILKDSIVLTHDAVRPFINERIIRENINAARKYGACNTCISAVDTIFISSDGKFISSVPDRSTVFHAQTPQSFDAEKLLILIENTPEEIFQTLTDGCSVFSYHEEKVAIVEGETYNIKITYPEDIKRAENIIKENFC